MTTIPLQINLLVEFCAKDRYHSINRYPARSRNKTGIYVHYSEELDAIPVKGITGPAI